MRIAITGGAGFLGARLARALLDADELSLAGAPPTALTGLRLLDRVAPPDDLGGDARVEALVGDLAALLADEPLRDVDAVVHLAAAVSAEAEADLDVGMVNNIDASRSVFDAGRRMARPPLVVFASSVAVFGAVSGYPLPAAVTDDTLPVPRSSYGTQKFVCEQLLSDYTRRGIVQGRNVRLMTVTVRPGLPNAAASGFVSGIIREPLAGVRAVCPVGGDTPIAVSSPRRTIDGLLRAITTDAAGWGPSLAVNFPALTVTPDEMVAAMDRVAGRPASTLVDWEPDPKVGAIVSSWPARFVTARADALGLTAEPDFDAIVGAYVDELAAPAATSRQ